ncbi:putative dna damage-binding protein 1 protein [Phaeoacremonium minimum UCRPA7]|uniref:Putative dna damage-binding protein 1 protein n=1 Tax=Phaeoacremonium minimum (strain UCR-PA7) TaxID=1286976 RepID=R8BP49_PHAM7|nr:putative dna damage-binding protein 1 protein [Phaeoacremonium minimum UCRPA7]EOO01065.1 putative dna damage-binding protein 1 protein [Phaeoacremonium minimum UCRPA7]
MAYIAPIHRPSSVRHALQLKLLSEDEDSLVLAKANRIEIWRLAEDHLVMVHSKVVHGTISMLQKLRPKDSSTDLLFVGTDRFQYFTLSWNPQTSQLDTVQTFEDMGEKHMRDSQSQDKCLVDPTGRFMALHLWEGVLTVLRLLSRKGTTLNLQWMEQVRLSELFIKASTFLPSETHPKLAFLYQTRTDNPDSKLATYQLTGNDADNSASKFDPTRDREISIDVPDPGAAILIPVRRVSEEQKRHNFRNVATARAHLGGLLVVGETRLLYIDQVTKVQVEAPLKEASIFVAWAEYDERNYFLADDYGRLHLLTINTDGSAVTGMQVTYIGKTARASSLVYLGDNILFVASHYGDSQLYRTDFSEDAAQFLHLLQTLPNIGPVLDFTVMDMGNREGDSQLGNEYSSGQARIVTGSGAYKDGSLRSVRSGVGLGDIGILADLKGVRDGKSLISLNIEKDLLVSGQNDVAENDQVACIHVAPDLLDIGVIGFWTSGSLSIVDLATLHPHRGEPLRRTDDNASIPRDIVLTQVLPPAVGGPTLFVAMEDGNVITYNFSTTDVTLSGRKSVVLGTRQARFHLLPLADGTSNIFATTEHPSLIYGSEGRIVYSAVTAEDATCICPFDTEAFPGSIAVATESQIKISQIDTERRTHVRSLEMGETIRRIAYSPKEQVFGLGCIKKELVHGEEVISSSFKLVDEVIFDNLGKPFILNTAPATELIECVIRATLSDAYGNPAERFLVGTSFIEDGEIASQQSEFRGRLLVLGVDSDRSPYQIMSHNLKGACRSLAVMDDMIVAALTKTVVVSKYAEQSTTSATLTRVASYRPSTYPIDLAVEGNIIAVADLMKSLSLVELVPAKDGMEPQLIECARHYQSGWATAVSHIEENSWLEADAQGNLMVLRRNPTGVTMEDQRRMEITSEINLGEMVNRIRKIAVETSPDAMIIPKAFLGTVEGAIYMFGTIAPQAQDLLMRFQAKLTTMVKTPGNIDFKSYRAFRNAEREGDGPFRFLDGELLERFLDVDEEIQEEICRGLGPSVENMRNIVEELKRMH